ncbi:hypothetical protein KY358_04440 [Candidatus Woesearchaeota archaeon]|nr:hypothetical protein [Candidatus Woesearchaeota archaeon]
MTNKHMLISAVMLLILALPYVSAGIKVRLGQPYANIGDVSDIVFKAHPDYYDICALDETIIPVLIENRNEFPDLFTFSADEAYVDVPVKNAFLKSGKGAILPLRIRPTIDSISNTTFILDIITKEEAIRRSVVIKLNIKKCYLFDLRIEEGKRELCGSDIGTYTLVLENNGESRDAFTLAFDVPGWVDIALENKTLILGGRETREIELEANPPSDEKGSFVLGAEAVSGRSKAVIQDSIDVTVFPEHECYNTAISAENMGIGYFGRNIPVKVSNRGIKDADYSLSIEGPDWHSLSQSEFSLKDGEGKTVNLALYPDEDTAEGEYAITINAIEGTHEFKKEISVKLRREEAFFGALGFYLNYIRYYLWMALAIILIILAFASFRGRDGRKKERKAKKLPVKEEIKGVSEQSKKDEEKIRIRRLRYILFPSLLFLLALFAYSTFRHRAYYEKASGFISGLFTDYAVPCGPYIRYAVIGFGILLIIILTIELFRKKRKKNKGGKKKKAPGKEALRPEDKRGKGVKKAERYSILNKPECRKEKKKAEKISSRRKKLNLFEHTYIFLSALIFLVVLLYSAYIFLGRPSWLKSDALPFFIKGYYLYILIGFLLLFTLISAIKIFGVFGKNLKIKGFCDIKKAGKKEIKRSRKKTRKMLKFNIRKFFIWILGLIFFAAALALSFYFKLVSHIRDFFALYYSYILMGAGILVILILVLYFHDKQD